MTAAWCERLDIAIDEMADAMVAIRRHLHSQPELSGKERETSMYLYQRLDDLGFAVRMGPEGCGVVVDSHSPWQGSGNRIVAVRADIDALPIHDAKQVAYRSQHDGVMHACGHDAHTAVVFGALAALRNLQTSGELPCDVRFRGVFQPAEETCEGARRMIEVGALEEVDAILATHVDPTRSVGKIGLRAGVLTASCDEMRIIVHGHGGHAARPHETSDPIAAAAQIINALYLYIPRVTDSQDAVVVTIGQVSGGENANVIPEEVLLRGTIRTLDRSVRRQTIEHVCRITEGIGLATRTKIDVHFGLGSDSVDNDLHLIQLLEASTREVLGDESIQVIPRASMGSEDFAFYLKHVPGAMIRLGCSSNTHGGSALHTPTFDIDERALVHGAKILARTVVYRSLEIAGQSVPSVETE